MSTETLNSSLPTDDVLSAAEGNGCRILGKIDLSKEAEQPPVIWFFCTFPRCEGRSFREEEAILPNLKAIAAKLGRENISLDDLNGFVLCRYHANLLEDKGIRCYLYLKTLNFLERQAEDAKGMDSFLGGYDPNIPQRQKSPPAQPLKTRVEIPRGRDFDSYKAKSKLADRKSWQGGKKNRGWADRN